MPKYVIRFSKEGYICYTSHLDIMRLFQRAFKKAGIKLRYSQGYNPHPRMGFAQPLSLGYSSDCELIEFETEEALMPDEIKERMDATMGESLEITGCKPFPEGMKKLAGAVESAVYAIAIPLGKDADKAESINIKQFMDNDEILAEKKQKKTKEMKEINIRPMIRKLDMCVQDSVGKSSDEEDSSGEKILTLVAELDAGSTSNLSPELLITAFSDFFVLDVERADIDIKRTAINFSNGYEF